MNSGDLTPHGRAPGDVTGLPASSAAETHRDTGATAGMTQGHDVTHCGL